MVRFELPNGLRGVVDPTGRSDVAAVYVWINVGSADEPPGMEGAAHVVEHMVFKGTRSYGVGEVAAAIEAMGGDLNAWTSFDETVFHATVPASAAVPALGVLAEMLREARFDPDELRRERKVILEEIRGADDDPDSVLSEATYAAAWPEHPYGRPIIGTTRAVRTMSRDALLGFYAEHYQPANASVVVTGPVDASAVQESAARLFGGGGAARPRPRLTPPNRRARPRVLRRGFEACLVELAYPGPALADPEVAALDVACLALGGGASSPLEARLKLREGLCVAADLALELERDAGMAVVALQAREGATADAVRVAREEIARALATGLAPDDVERAKAQILADRVFGRETVDGRAYVLAMHGERYGDPDAWRDADARVDAVTVDDANDALRRCLAPEREIAVALLPDGEALSLARPRSRAIALVDAPRNGKAVPTIAHAPFVARASEPRRVKLEGGVRVILHPEDAEIAAIRVAGIGGAFGETARTAGRTSAWARTLVRGAGEHDAVGFARAVESLAGSVAASGSRSTQAVRAELVSARFEEGLGLLCDALLRPAFADAEVERVRAELLEAIESRDDHPEHVLMERVWAEAYGDHPYGFAPLGTRETVARLDPAGLAAAHAYWATPGNLVVAVTGGYDPDRVLSLLRRELAHLRAGPAPVLPSPPTFPSAPRRVTLQGGREQAHVAFAYPGVTITSPAQPAVDILAGTLGGQGGRLFLELREAHGLAYAVSAMSHEGLHDGLFVCALATDPDRLDEAEARLRESVGRAVDGLTDDEIERARSYLVGALELDLQTTSSRAGQAAYAELYGLDGLLYRSRVRERLLGVSVDEVRAWARRILTRPLVEARLAPVGG